MSSGNIIFLLEPQCIAWQHEMVNAGMLQLVEGICCDERLVFCAEERHISNVFDIVGEITEKRIIAIPDDITDFRSRKHIEIYYDIGKDMLAGVGTKAVILLSSCQSNMCAFAKLAKENPNVRFIIIVHAIMEWMFSIGRIKRGGFRQKQKRAIQLVRDIKTCTKMDNVFFVSYSPFIAECASYIGRKSSSKFVFLHHPYPQLKFEKNDRKEGKLGIGILGACANETSLVIAERCSSESVEFIFFNKDKRITREQMNSMLKEVDCLLIPYNKEKYRISASGVLFDAVNYGIPIIGLDSPILKYYNDRFDIGWIFESVESLCASINQNRISREELKLKEKNMSIMRDVVKSENIDTIRSLLYKD